MTVREVAEGPPHFVRETHCDPKVIKELMRGNRVFTAGAAIWRIRTQKQNFSRSDRLAINATQCPIGRFAALVFLEYQAIGFTYEEMDDFENRNINREFYHPLALITKIKEEIQARFLLPAAEIREIVKIYKRRANRFRWGPFSLIGDETNFLNGVLTGIQKAHGLTHHQALLVPFLLYKAVVEYPPRKRMKGLQKILGDFGLPITIAQDIFPDMIWKGDEEKMTDDIRLLERQTI